MHKEISIFFSLRQHLSRMSICIGHTGTTFYVYTCIAIRLDFNCYHESSRKIFVSITLDALPNFIMLNL